ncbi:tautomerase family protein [Liquorilactobacillus satsumensis]|uniref:4-oxalocrotonate tautomerase n=1 Tax=Liquorilactobacillus satsumensis DSM 16230 = JCM 12392 TaxID=1423801 RepID=A0A0R1V5W2_9LACO|nr:tautomerase family protein [Liquorilactobacillus satsumensis]KRL98947.1 hypothetical protein FD50_GL000766 [Liquorilactobacillus satsumensis DSM 16230 = JCM 12392]MCP9327878.1 tautomerase family protein [Liquorilactobacillus satsumensis]
MPFVKIFHGAKLDERTTESVNKIIHAALEKHFFIPQDDTFQLWISTNSKINYIDNDYLLSKAKRNENFVYIEIFCGPGRKVEQKQELYNTIAKRIGEETIITPQNIFILLNEVPVENWSFGEGKAQMLK